MTLSILVIGCGHIATAHHGPALAAHAAVSPELRLEACCDTDAARAATFAGKFGFARSYADAATMLAAERADAVMLLVPPDRTAALAASVMAAGCRNLLIEKPPGLNSDEARTIHCAAQLHGATPMVAFNRRHMPVVRELRGRLGLLPPGDIHHIRYELIRYRRTDRDFSVTAIHGLDTARFLAGSDYAQLEFAYKELPHISQGVANISARGSFVSGTAVDLIFAPVSGANIERVTVHARDRMLVAELPFGSSLGGCGRLIEYRDGAVSDLWEVDSRPGDGNGFHEEIGEFLSCAAEGRAPEDDVLSAVQAVEAAACIRNRAGRYGNSE